MVHLGNPLHPLSAPILHPQITPPDPQQLHMITSFLGGPFLGQMLQRREMWQMYSPDGVRASTPAIYGEWLEGTAIYKGREMHS